MLIMFLAAGGVGYAYLRPAGSLGNHHRAVEGPAGSLRWQLLAKATGFGFTKNLQYIPRRYPEAVKELANTEVRIEGYMIALQPRAEISQFLLVPFPPSCPYCVPAGPNEIVQVHMHAPVAYAVEPVLVRGILRLGDDLTDGFYTMDDSEIASP